LKKRLGASLATHKNTESAKGVGRTERSLNSGENKKTFEGPAFEHIATELKKCRTEGGGKRKVG